MKKHKIFVLIGLIISLTNCQIADLRTRSIKKNIQKNESADYAKKLLQEVVHQQGMDNLDNFKTYEILCTDHWKGVAGKMGNPWGWNKNEMILRYSVGDFDGQVEVLTGQEKGFVAGIQSWGYYESINGKYKTSISDDDKVFMIAAYHFFFELAVRLNNAPIIRYVGCDRLGENEIEKIFVSWSNSRTKLHDQFMLFINKKTKLIDAVQFTTRDSSLPGAAYITGALLFEDYQNVQGVLIPYKQTGQIGKPKVKKSYIHQITIKQFQWDSFPVSDIRPFSHLKPIGDTKPD